MQDELSGSAAGSGPSWELYERIGKGSFGVVYRGMWRGLEVAIKRTIFQVGMASSQGKECAIVLTMQILRFAIHASPPRTPAMAQEAGTRSQAMRNSTLREVAINAALNHPNIVMTYAYDMQPLAGGEASRQQIVEVEAACNNGQSCHSYPKAFCDWQMYIIQVQYK